MTRNEGSGPLRSANDLVLFVAGEPETMPSVRGTGMGLLSRTAMAFGGSAFVPEGSGHPRTSKRGMSGPPGSPSATQAPPWHLPPQQTMCVNLVREIAEQRGRSVTVVDVDRPAPDQRPLIERWVRTSDVLPLLVRPDGARLEGLENFEPGTVRKFIDRP